MNTMPCMLPEKKTFGCKIVTRYERRTPSVDGELLLYDYETGELLALMDAFWITSARTGAVAALAVETLAPNKLTSIGMLGLGNTAKATLACLHAVYPQRSLEINLLSYKNHAEKMMEFGEKYHNFKFRIIKNLNDLVSTCDVIISCITYTEGPLAPDECFRPGCLVVPVHTRGFQNCDLFFDKVFADDTDHVKGFRYFDRFRSYAEISDVLNGTALGRESDEEKILSYNIGLAMHDILFATKIYSMSKGSNIDFNKGRSDFSFS